MGTKTLSSRAIIGEFYNRLEQPTGGEYIDGVSNFFTSNQESETYAWLGMSPAMREWVGGRQAKGFRENGMTIKNKLFEATMEVLVDDMRRDKTGQIMARVREMADRTNAHWHKLVSDFIVNGGARLCYDGQYFFDTDHSEGDSGSQSNAITYDSASTTVPTTGEMEKAIMAAVQQVLGFKDDQGEPMNEGSNSFLVMVPVNMMQAAAGALKNPVIVDGGQARTNLITNIGGFNFSLSVNQRLTASDKFFLFDTSKEMKALIRQEEEGVRLDAVAEGSELEFRERKHQYGVTAIRNVGYGYWQRAVQTTLV